MLAHCSTSGKPFTQFPRSMVPPGGVQRDSLEYVRWFERSNTLEELLTVGGRREMGVGVGEEGKHEVKQERRGPLHSQWQCDLNGETGSTQFCDFKAGEGGP